MTIPEQVQNDYKRWHHFLEQEVQFSLSGSEKHTKEHCDRDDALDRFRLGPNGLDVRYLRTAGNPSTVTQNN